MNLETVAFFNSVEHARTEWRLLHQIKQGSGGTGCGGEKISGENPVSDLVFKCGLNRLNHFVPGTVEFEPGNPEKTDPADAFRESRMNLRDLALETQGFGIGELCFETGFNSYKHRLFS